MESNRVGEWLFSPTRRAPRVPHGGLFPLHGAAHKKGSCALTVQCNSSLVISGTKTAKHFP